MNFLIIQCHPYEGSFNAGAAGVIRQTLKQKGHFVTCSDLVADGFDPVMRGEDLKAWRQGKSADPMVRDYQDQIKAADVLVFPFPVWWGMTPAVLKGFCEKVLLPGWAYRYGKSGEMIGLLSGKKAVVITTMETPKDVFETYYNNPVKGAFLKDTLEPCGLEIIKYFLIDQIVSGGREYAQSKMNEIAAYFEGF